jgi:hypothetical protein
MRQISLLLCKIAASIIPVALAFSAASARAPTTTETQVFDLVPAFRPTPAEKTVPFFRSQRMEGGTGCSLRYRIVDGKVQTKWRVIEDSEGVRKLFRAAPVQIATWWADPALCSPDAKIDSGPDWVKVSVSGPNDTAQSVTFQPDKLRMRVRSVEQFTKRFGSSYFRASPRRFRGNKDNEYANVRFPEPIRLDQISTLRLLIDAELVKADINTGCVDDNAPEGAQSCYQPKRMATQFRIATGNITWRDPRCRRHDPDDSICRYQGKFMQSTISLFDERKQFQNNDFFDQKGTFEDARTRVPIFRIDLHTLLSRDSTSNPFMKIGARAVAQGDILVPIKNALLKASEDGRMPPRLVKADGSRETDDEYFSHYTLGAMNIGYEVTGLSDITFDIYRFTMTAEPVR